jgi:hypothetical protein
MRGNVLLLSKARTWEGIRKKWMIQRKQVQPFTIQENMYFTLSFYSHVYLQILHSSNPQSGGGSFSLSLSAEHCGHERNPVGKDMKEKTC